MRFLPLVTLGLVLAGVGASWHRGSDTVMATPTGTGTELRPVTACPIAPKAKHGHTSNTSRIVVPHRGANSRLNRVDRVNSTPPPNAYTGAPTPPQPPQTHDDDRHTSHAAEAGCDCPAAASTSPVHAHACMARPCTTHGSMQAAAQTTARAQTAANTSIHPHDMENETNHSRGCADGDCTPDTNTTHTADLGSRPLHTPSPTRPLHETPCIGASYRGDADRNHAYGHTPK